VSFGELDLHSLGNNIKLLRKKVGISQTQLANKIDVSQTHMSNIENGNTGISLSMACKIAHVLECSLDELVYGIKEHKDDDMNMPLSVCSLGDFVRAMKICVVQTQHETTDKDDDSKNITDLKEK
jgi:hypothetical protein